MANDSAVPKYGRPGLDVNERYLVRFRNVFDQFQAGVELRPRGAGALR